MGTCAAYFLNQLEPNASVQITLFDSKNGQATKAAAGIISPWLSKRRNQHWYHLARDGATVVKELATATNMDGLTYANNGTIITRKNIEQVQELEQLAYNRKQTAPLMGEIQVLQPEEIKQALPMLTKMTTPGLFISGGSWIDGNRFCQHLLSKCPLIQLRSEKVDLVDDHHLQTKQGVQRFDQIILATGAWTKKVLSSVHVQADIRPQKGQLIEIKLPHATKANCPVLMPESEYDFIPVATNRLIIGATHEDHSGFDLSETETATARLLQTASHLVAGISLENVILKRVGTRAYTSDYGPFVGQVPGHPDLLVGTGLGSSGLTTGPLVGQLLARLALGQSVDLEYYSKPITNYLRSA
ncbi:FAD-binding oxidoreductase [Fructilactobacillus hinvesii]|uniref:FAD-binding oxidoreductase n=1 Tax=Fructilactobacillus hinvesii TaxID=2940300 RepID=A0ABY5BSS4_9LACO|nr:FAD-binding oxidoreductase [Fructilactobacillus hinvesii]